MEISKRIIMEDENLIYNLNNINWGDFKWDLSTNPCREIPMNDYIASVDVANGSDVSVVNIWRRHLTGTPDLSSLIEKTARENMLQTMESMNRAMSLDFTSLYPSLMTEMGNSSIFDDFTYTPFDDYIFRHRFIDDWLYYPCPT